MSKNIWFLGKKKKFVSQTFANKKLSAMLFSPFFLENDQWKMQEFFLYSVFGPLFFFFFFFVANF